MAKQMQRTASQRAGSIHGGDKPIGKKMKNENMGTGDKSCKEVCLIF